MTDHEANQINPVKAALDKCSARDKLFVIAYCETLNVALATNKAGLKHPRTGYSILRKPEVAEAINEVMRAHMGENEVLVRLARIARGDMTDFITVQPREREYWVALDGREIEASQRELIEEYGRDAVAEDLAGQRYKKIRVDETEVSFDWNKAEELGQLGLIKKIKRDKDGAISFELHDSVRALELIGKHYKLFTEVTQHQGDPNAPVEVRVVREIITRPTGEK